MDCVLRCCFDIQILFYVARVLICEFCVDVWIVSTFLSVCLLPTFSILHLGFISFLYLYLFMILIGSFFPWSEWLLSVQ